MPNKTKQDNTPRIPCTVGTELNYCGALWTVVSLGAGFFSDKIFGMVIKSPSGETKRIRSDQVRSSGLQVWVKDRD